MQANPKVHIARNDCTLSGAFDRPSKAYFCVRTASRQWCVSWGSFDRPRACSALLAGLFTCTLTPALLNIAATTHSTTAGCFGGDRCIGAWLHAWAVVRAKGKTLAPSGGRACSRVPPERCACIARCSERQRSRLSRTRRRSGLKRRNGHQALHSTQRSGLRHERRKLDGE